MSKFNNTQTQYKNGSASKQTVANKYFCKVCQDAGKPESIYTSHNVRQTQDKTAPVTCPTLLAQECRYCHKSCHSIKYCPIIKEQNDRKEQYQQPVEKKAVKAPAPAKKSTHKNVYMIFADESDEEREREQERIRNPVPTPQIIKKQAPSVISYASILQNQSKDQNTEKQAKEKAKEPEKVKEPEIKEVKAYVPITKKPQAKINWADCDSDDEEEYYASIKEDDVEETSAW